MPFVRYGRPGLLSTVARTAIVAGTATATANAVNRRAAERAQLQQEAAAYEAAQQTPQYAPPPPPAAAPGGDDLVGRLGELARLREAGALTAEEFDAAKAKLLAG